MNKQILKILAPFLILTALFLLLVCTGRITGAAIGLFLAAAAAMAMAACIRQAGRKKT